MWSFTDDLLLYDGKVFILESSPLCPRLLAAFHDLGHEGVHKILHHLCAHFHVPGMH